MSMLGSLMPPEGAVPLKLSPNLREGVASKTKSLLGLTKSILELSARFWLDDRV